MKSIVITTRISVAAICAAGEFLEKSDPGTITNQPISTTTRTVMESLMIWLEEGGKVQEFSKMKDKELTTAYYAMFEPAKDQPHLSEATGLNLDDLDTLIRNTQPKAASQELDIESISAAVEKAVVGSSDVDVSRGTDRVEVNDPVSKGNLWVELVPMNLEDAIGLKPNSPTLNALQSEVTDPLVSHVVLSVCCMLKVDQWDTRLFEATIDRYMDMHDGSEK